MDTILLELVIYIFIFLGLINFLALATLMIAVCAKAFGQAGYLRDWINDSIGYSEENVTDWAKESKGNSTSNLI